MKTKTILITCSLFLVAFLVAGCATGARTVYVASDRRIESCTNTAGVACKAVPDAVFAEMLVTLKELENMKKERKVESRLSTPKN